MYKHRVEIRDGEAIIVGHLYIPDEESDRPCVVISHEFGVDQNWETRYAIELARRSYPVFTYDFPGSGNGCSTGRDTREMSILTEVGDLRAVIGYLRKRLGDKDLVLCGFSMGGMVSALAAAELGEEIAGLILVYPALSASDDARNGKALGARPGSILKLIVTESVLITAFFGYIGMLLGMIACQILDMTVGQSKMEIFGESFKMLENPTVGLSTAIGATIVLIIAGTVAGIFPARKAAKVKPIEALRAE